MIGLRRSQAWIFVLLWLDIAVLGDVMTGTTLWFGPAYLFVMCLAAWCLGWRAGMAIGISSTALTFVVNGVALYPNGSAEIPWNLTARFLAIALVIAVVAGSRRAYVREWWLARRDPLTGVFNRKAFFELAEGFARSKSWRILLFADLDGLKGINDVHGHSAGDLALKTYAEAIRRNIRQNDLFARVGGDEFLIFMHVNDEASARAVAERLHRQMNYIPLQHGKHSRCSLGALVIPPSEKKIDDLVRLADAAMYRAKFTGASLEIETLVSDHSSNFAGRGRQRPREAHRGERRRFFHERGQDRTRRSIAPSR
jgi:diguanylate cyclase (GGDEF)-like protein